MSEENKLIGKTFICVTREFPAKNPDDEKEEIEGLDTNQHEESGYRV